MTDITKLKELAERASVGDWSYSPCVAGKHFLGQIWNADGESLCIMDHMTEQANADGAYIAAANPQAILWLIAEAERLYDMTEKAQAHALDMGNSALESKAEIARIKAENEALKEKIQRYQVRDKKNSGIIDALLELPGAQRAIAKALEGGGR